jgi:hypothetical protein
LNLQHERDELQSKISEVGHENEEYKRKLEETEVRLKEAIAEAVSLRILQIIHVLLNLFYFNYISNVPVSIFNRTPSLGSTWQLMMRK